MADNRKQFTDEQYYDDLVGTGRSYYSNLTLEDIINTFMVAYVGEDKVLTSVPRHEVALWGQRAVAEFSYDVFRSQKTWEIELNPDTLVGTLPQDFVSSVEVYAFDRNGNKLPLQPTDVEPAVTSPLQNKDYNLETDGAGDQILAEGSLTLERWQKPDIEFQISVNEDAFYGEYLYEYPYYGRKRYGLNPKDANVNPKYYINPAEGQIFITNRWESFGTDTLPLNIVYVSDGLSAANDFTNVLVPKMAEQAVYNYILYKLCSVRPSTVALAPSYKQEFRAEQRNAKIRLQNFSPTQFYQVMKQKAKWIKY